MQVAGFNRDADCVDCVDCVDCIASQVAAFNRDGFVLPGAPLLAPAEVAHHAALWEKMFDAHAEGDGFGVNGFFKRYGGAYDLVRHPALVAVARDLLCQNVVGWGVRTRTSTSFCTVSHAFSSPAPLLTRRAAHVPVVGHACGMLIGACDPML